MRKTLILLLCLSALGLQAQPLGRTLWNEGWLFSKDGESRVLELAFGVVAMVAMTPLITIQSLGFNSVLSTRRRRNAAMRRILASTEEDPIIYFE